MCVVKRMPDCSQAFASDARAGVDPAVIAVLTRASHAPAGGATLTNRMARAADAVQHISGVALARPVEAVFARTAPAATQSLRAAWALSDWDTRTGEVRWMCTRQTSRATVAAAVNDIRASIAAGAP
jgi:threonine aldolase